jgi:hypothetical protein
MAEELEGVLNNDRNKLYGKRGDNYYWLIILFYYSISKDINILNFYYFIILYLIYGWTNNLIILIFI